VRENASQRSVDAHQWFKSKPPTADTDVDVRRLWYAEKPTLRNSRTGGDVKTRAGYGYGERVGKLVGQSIGKFKTEFQLTMMAANSSKIYQCRQCEFSCTTGNKKRDMIKHLKNKANKQCLILYSESTDQREIEWVRAAQIQ